jgi:hypothetical protein
MTDPTRYIEAASLAAKILTPLVKDLVPYLLGEGPLPAWFTTIPSPTRSQLALDARKAKAALKASTKAAG